MKYFILLLTIVLASCGAGSKSIITPPEKLVLKVNEKITLGGLVITLKEVNESRCPANVNCVRAGEAVAVLNVVVNNESERNISLCTGADCSARGLSGTYPLSLGEQKYLFQLDSITTVDQEAKRAYFSVTQPK